MRRWNGWGDSTIDYSLPVNASAFLEKYVGKSSPPQDANLEEVIASVPASRIKSQAIVTIDPKERVCHACGQSLPDWIALRSGKIPVIPDGVAKPQSEEDIKELLQLAARTGAKLIPYGGGTSVTGHINPLVGDDPVISVNMRRLNRLTDFDKQSHLAKFGAGVSGPELETQLRALGFTLGHFPQSFELSTLGGWIATRSSGQQSLGYGRIEDLFAGGTLISPAGTLRMPPLPASAAGPDLRQLISGSEGRMGFITEAIMRASPLPEQEDFHALFFPNFDQGQSAVKKIIQAKLPLSMLRLSTAVETETTLALAGHERLIATLQQLMSFRGVSDEKVMLLAGFTGQERIVKTARKEALAIARKHGGIHVGKQFGKQWHKGRFHTPYLRNTLWEAGYAIDTLETAVPWENVTGLINHIENTIKESFAANNERVHVFTHLSHMYADGASIYSTYLFKLAADPQETMQQWRAAKDAASRAIINSQGTISHQHGVGLDHVPYLFAEKDELGMAVIGDTVRRFDPRGIMNPGKLI